MLGDGFADEAEVLGLNAFEVSLVAGVGVLAERGGALGGRGADHVREDQGERCIAPTGDEEGDRFFSSVFQAIHLPMVLAVKRIGPGSVGGG